MKKHLQKGIIFLEILIAIALVSIVFVMLMGIGFSTLTLTTTLQKTAEADSLIREELEAARSFREGTIWATNGLATLNTGSANPYRAILDTSVNPPKWTFVAGAETVGEYTRSIVFDRVSRNPSTFNIETIYNANNDDVNTRKITVTVTRGNKTYQVVSYLTNWNQ